MISMDLDAYGVSQDRGFLSPRDADDVILPDLLKPIITTAMSLPRLLVSGNVRPHIAALPQIDLTEFCAQAKLTEQRAAFVHYSFLVQSYVWGEPDAPRSLPASIAVPIWQLSESIGQPPLLTYSAYVLDNWGRIDAREPINLSNIYMNQPFLGGQDEAWFVLIHVAIEARAGAMLATIPSLIQACEAGDDEALESGMAAMSEVWNDMNAIFDRMPERCDPYVYFHRVRPWIHGWKDNPALVEGLVYEGVTGLDGKPQSFRGQTGSQSSIVPAMDAFLGVAHAGDPLRTYLDQLHIYRPPEHRRFIDDIRASSRLRDHIQERDHAGLKSVYNDCIENLTRFRTRHLEYAASYINKQSRGGSGNTSEIGTGGTPFMKYLKKHRDEAGAHLLR